MNASPLRISSLGPRGEELNSTETPEHTLRVAPGVYEVDVVNPGGGDPRINEDHGQSLPSTRKEARTVHPIALLEPRAGTVVAAGYRLPGVDLELGGKVAVVTGASKGIGFAVVRELAAEGATVVAGARNVETLEGVDGVTSLAVDLAGADGPARLISEAIARHGRVDVLVNNVGGAHARTEGFLALSDSDFAQSLELNFFAALRATRAAIEDMRKRHSGTIINVASVNSFFEPDGGVIDYGAAKAALVNTAKSLSQELGPQGIRITNVSPGPVATDLWLGDAGVAADRGTSNGR